MRNQEFKNIRRYFKLDFQYLANEYYLIIHYTYILGIITIKKLSMWLYNLNNVVVLLDNMK